MMHRRPAETQVLGQYDAVTVAQSLRTDFAALIAIFDRQRMNDCAHYNGADADISDAIAAAERGLRLSEQLVELLRRTS